MNITGTLILNTVTENEIIKYRLRNKYGLTINILENSSIYTIEYDGLQLNQVAGNPLEGGLNNIFLRVYNNETIVSYPLTGIQSNSRFQVNKKQAAWTGEILNYQIKYECLLTLNEDENLWYWTINLTYTGSGAISADLIYAQDIALTAKSAVRSNEMYTSHYIDHSVSNNEKHGYMVFSRQNSACNGQHPWLLQGCLAGAAGYLTDGYDFFGRSYKDTNIPETLNRKKLLNQNRQYEFAYTVLQSEKMKLTSGKTGT